ncbi:hypothetical protein ABZ178_12105 [Streptomyces massasporeus]|uniref:hypothetical protein n=1 Tax=Streptomyces massasporeus TaxID=67324 RepID=UPI0033B33696
MLYVITGPPAAGKSSWIDAHAKPEDVVIDLDRITVALTGPGAPHWNHAPLQHRVAQRADTPPSTRRSSTSTSWTST